MDLCHKNKVPVARCPVWRVSITMARHQVFSFRDAKVSWLKSSRLIIGEPPPNGSLLPIDISADMASAQLASTVGDHQSLLWI